MKKQFTIIAFAAMTFVIGLASCEQIAAKLFKAFVTGAAEEDFSINVITTTAVRGDIGSLSLRFNLDSLIRDETDGAFNLSSIESINMEEAKLIILNPDPTNNFANFEEGWLTFNTDANTTPVQIATGLNPDVYGDVWLMPVDNSINLKDYLQGTQLSYLVAAKARRVTDKVLNCKIAVKFKVN